MRATPLILIFLMAGLAGCSRPAITGDDSGTFVPGAEPRVGFRMVDAGFWTNGSLRSDRISLSSDDFTMLFVYLPESGLYIVTIDETENSRRSGRFAGPELLFSAGRTEIRFQSQDDHLFDDRVDREAWVEFLPHVNLSADGRSADVAIVDLAREREHIPGL